MLLFRPHRPLLCALLSWTNNMYQIALVPNSSSTFSLCFSIVSKLLSSYFCAASSLQVWLSTSSLFIAVIIRLHLSKEAEFPTLPYCPTKLWGNFEAGPSELDGEDHLIQKNFSGPFWLDFPILFTCTFCQVLPHIVHISYQRY